MTTTRLPSDYQEFIAISKYARWLPDKNRRESWDETVNRYIRFFQERFSVLDNQDRNGISSTTNSSDDVAFNWDELRNAILNLEVMPSMRALMTAGPALERDNVAGYNCAYQAIKGRGKEISIFNDEIKEIIGQPIIINLKNPITFDEIMYILLCGTGDGFSVERQYVNELPTVGKRLSRRIYSKNNTNFPGVDKDDLSSFDRATNTIVVEDSKYGWASALRILIVELYNGNFPKWDLSKVRPAGAPLKIFGGRASGPGPLDELFRFTSEIFRGANGRKLRSIECHDIVCKIADTVVVGGVRRSACLSLSNLSDDRMRLAKSGNFFTEKQRRLANNSVCYTEKPNALAFIQEWSSLIESGSGERGIFNRTASQKAAARNGRRDSNQDFGTNPLISLAA